MQKPKDYYKILGIDRNASDEDIKKAFKKRSKETHPDLHPNDKEKEEEFKQVNEAYQILSDKDKKYAYDTFGTTDGSKGFGGNGTINPEDFFRHFSGGFGGSSHFGFDPFGGYDTSFNRKRDPFAPRKGQSIVKDITISFFDSIYGNTKHIKLQIPDVCDKCDGTCAENKKMKTCQTCNGSGFVIHTQTTSFGRIQQQTLCKDCNGRGSIPEEKCKHCNGTGTVTAERNIHLKIDPSISQSCTYSFKGEGFRGFNGGERGDCMLNVHINEDELYERNGLDLYTEKYISPLTAAIGGKIDLVTPFGDIEVKIKPGTKNESTLCLRDKGIKHNNQTGNLYVLVKFDSISNLNNKQIKELEKIRNLIKEDNLLNYKKEKTKESEFIERMKRFKNG